MNESSFLSKRPSTSEVNSVNPKKSKPSEGVCGTNSSAVFSSAKSLSVTSPQAVPSKGKYEMWHTKGKYSIYIWITEIVVQMINSSYWRLKSVEFWIIYILNLF